MNRGLLAVCLCMLVPGAGAFAESLHVRIDRIIESASEKKPAPPADDTEFLRRVYLDFAGVIPSAAEVRSFLEDDSPAKRSAVIDRLLEGPEFARTMRDRFHVHLMERRGDDETWLTWLEESFRANKPWDRMVREIVRADFRDEPNRGAAYFYSRRLEKYGQNPTDYPGLTRDVGRLFLGMDLQCAECHNHKLIKDYDQIDFQGLMAAFSKLKPLREDYPAVEEQLTVARHEYASVFNGKQRETGPRIPGLPEIEPVSFEKGNEYVQAPDRKTKTPGIPRFSPLAEFSKQVSDAPTFSMNIVNRVWFLMMGRGFVEPLDQFHDANPASHPGLLELIATEFAAHGYDLKWLFRELALTRTYQRSGRFPEDDKRPEERAFLVAMERPLLAEQLLASTLRAVGVNPEDAPLENVEAEDGGEDFVGLRERFRNAYAGEAKLPEYRFSPSMKSALFAMNDPELARLIRRDDALPARLAGEADISRIAGELFLQVFGRMPSPEETGEVAEYLEAFEGPRKEAIADVLWAMLGSTEFVVNH